MRLRAWPLARALIALLGVYLLLNCGEKSTQPEDELNVSNDNPFCGLVAGFVRDSSGEGLQGVTVCITPVPPARVQSTQGIELLQSFMNYPNPFSSHTYFTYFLIDHQVQGVRISIYNLRHELVRQFLDAPTSLGPHHPNKLYFDALDQQGEILPDGLYPCEALVLSPEDTASTQVALAKGINVPSEGELQSYMVTTQSDGKYVIADVLLNILLRITNVVAPEDSINYPENWPYAERDLEIGEQFILQASSTGYAAATDTVTLAAGQVTRADFTLR
jgi:hypothetical protein